MIKSFSQMDDKNNVMKTNFHFNAEWSFLIIL